jgi:hypothetical protein
MVSDQEPRSAEALLLTQLAGIERQIADLERQRFTLQRLVIRVRQQGLSTQDVTRKNSFDRIMAENAIVTVLSSAPGGSRPGYVSMDEIHREVRLAVPTIKPTTFRSYLHRMKERGLIEQSDPRGHWRLAQRPSA